LLLRFGFALVALVLFVSACDRTNFPVTPTPVASNPIVQQGSSYTGTILFPDGSSKPFNMTLIARALAGSRMSVSGNFETGDGRRGTVQGTIAGTLDNGNFDGTLKTESGGTVEERRFAGPVTLATIAWVPGDCVGTCTPQGLVFSVQVAVPGAEPCSYSISPTSVFAPVSGTTQTVSVTTPPTCAWAAQPLVTWLTISGAATGSGSGTVTFAVLPNAGEARQGTVTVAGQAIAVNQSAQEPGPEKAANPFPANAATGVGPTPTLTWSAAGAISYDVYFGATLPAAPTATTTMSRYTPSALNPNTTYRWRIDARNAVAVTTGDVWTFTTGAATAPRMSVDPPTGTRVTSFRFTATGLTPNGAATLQVRDPQGAIVDQTLVASASGTVGGGGDPAQPVSLGTLGISEAWILDLTWGTSSNRVSFTVTSRCDLNSDFVINTTDVSLVQDAALGNSTDSKYDLNRDGQINVVDIQIVFNATMNAASCPL
jgi:hypothetical protein